jgi:hypothetical protein
VLPAMPPAPPTELKPPAEPTPSAAEVEDPVAVELKRQSEAPLDELGFPEPSPSRQRAARARRLRERLDELREANGE